MKSIENRIALLFITERLHLHGNPPGSLTSRLRIAKLKKELGKTNINKTHCGGALLVTNFQFQFFRDDPFVDFSSSSITFFLCCMSSGLHSCCLYGCFFLLSILWHCLSIFSGKTFPSLWCTEEEFSKKFFRSFIVNSRSLQMKENDKGKKWTEIFIQWMVKVPKRNII